MVNAARERALRLAGAAWPLLTKAWKSEATVLATIAVLQMFFARRTFQGGIWADNDSVCHYAYLRHLLEDVYPATGTFLGYSPKFNMGVPFLLYNTPPGTYVIAAVVATALHLSALVALKICILAGFLSVPMLGFWIAKTFDDAPEDSPKFVAIMLAFYSSELYGLEFFFKNGMLNPALGIPFLLATLYFFRRLQTSELPRGLRYVALGGFFFACTVCTHVLSTYMLCLALGGFVLGRPFKSWGHDVLRLGAMLAVGGGLAAFWLIPSAPFAAAKDAAYTWLRRPEDIVSSFFDGSLFASYFAGFFPRFVTVSNVGVVAVALGFYALLMAYRKARTGPLSALYVFLVGFLVMLGPAWSIGIRYLPAYDRLLWYRFLTLAEIGWLILAGFGAAFLAHGGRRLFPYNRIALVVGIGWMLVVMADRATKIETAADYPDFTADVDDAASWLKEHGDRRGRIYDEFLGQGVIQPPSVNYIRHMMPILSGYNEIGGWIYENNLAGQVLMKKGVFWYSPFSMVEEAPTYNVKYILAGTPHFIRALSIDPRWKSVATLKNLVLFENAAYEPAFAEGQGLSGNVSSEHYVRGGGYEYVVDLKRDEARTAHALLVKVGYLPGFSVYADDDPTPLTLRPSLDGLLEVELPPSRTPHRLRVTWDISALRAKGNRISLACLVFALTLVGLSFVRLRAMPGLARPLHIVGIGAAALALVGIVIKGRKVDLSEVGFGARNGLSSIDNPEMLKVGSYDDDHPSAPIHVNPAAWDKRGLLRSEPARKLVRPDLPAVQLALPRRGGAKLTLTGTPDRAPLSMTLEVPGGPVTCKLEAVMNEPVAIPPECTVGGDVGPLPGITRDLRITSNAALEVTSVHADTGITVVEAESLRNRYDDGGYEAFYGFGAIEAPPSNGIVMTADVRYGKPVDLAGRFPAGSGRYGVWLLTRTFHQRFRNTRAEVSLWIDDTKVGASRGESQRLHEFWEHDTVFEWVHLGEADVARSSSMTLQIAKIKGTPAGLADVDAVAFAPL